MNISVQGAPIYFTIPIFGGIPISATLVVTWLIMAIVTGLCLWLTHDMKVSNVSKRQAVAEFLVETARNFTVGNMGEKFAYFTPFVAALFTLSLLSNLISLVGLYSPTADLSTEAAWAVACQPIWRRECLAFINIAWRMFRVGPRERSRD